MAEQLEPVPSVRVHQDGDRESLQPFCLISLPSVFASNAPVTVSCKPRFTILGLAAAALLITSHCVPEDVGRAGLLV